MMDYESLKLIWWLFVGILLIGFAITDGFDLGVASILPWVARTDGERRVVINAIGPVWEGNQVWLITAGGALFAAWPLVYAVSFSGLYMAFMLLLVALILRPIGFDFRSKLESVRWRSFWDQALCISGIVPSLVFGIAFGNLLQGLPFLFDGDLRIVYQGGFFQLLNPFALLVGVVSLSMLVMHGSSYLMIRVSGALWRRASFILKVSTSIYLVSFVLSSVIVCYWLIGYEVVSMPSAGTSFVPMEKRVSVITGGWLLNYYAHPSLWVAPFLTILGGGLAFVLTLQRRALSAFLASSLSIIGTILTFGFGMFPFVLPSSIKPDHSLTLWDSVSSHYTLQLMFWAVVLFLPIVITYTALVYRVMRGMISEEDIKKNKEILY